jgi:hypothetical protein
VHETVSWRDAVIGGPQSVELALGLSFARLPATTDEGEHAGPVGTCALTLDFGVTIATDPSRCR